jgi:N-acetylglucosaminyl-diphospho-decaprenol L-rhamnosyltransferase
MSGQPHASIDVVVPVYENYELTASCLAHLAAQDVAHRVIVVDDGSRDGTAARVREQWPAVTLLELGENRGYTHAVNAGVAAGAGELVVLLNNDVELRPDCVGRLVAPLAADERVGSVASLMLRPGEEQIDSLGLSADPTLAAFARLQGSARDQASAGAPLLSGPEGTAGAYRRAAWEQVGGFDEAIPAYMEVLDLALRLAIAGWQTVAAPDAVGVHLGSATYGRRSPEQRRLAGYSRGYLLRRYGVLRGRFAARALLTDALVVTIDALTTRDLKALRGRLAGWHAAAGAPRHPWPPASAIDGSITLLRSLELRRGALRG